MKIASFCCWVALFLTRTNQVSAECPPDGCGPFGECQLDTISCGDDCQERCKCQPGYFGDDCSFQAEICADEVGPGGVQTCLNGGHCYKVDHMSGAANEYEYQCDCRKAYGDASAYAGHQCEYPAEVSCEKSPDQSRNDVSPSSYAFCVNGGVCLQLVERGEAFPGCRCSIDYAGRHCQYATGTAPAEELVYAPPPSGKLSSGAIAGIVIAGLVFVVGVALVANRHHSSQAPTDDKQVPPPPMDLQLEEIPPKQGETEPDGEII